MRTLLAGLLAIALTTTLMAQSTTSRQVRPPARTGSAEIAVKQALEILGEERKLIERDMAVLRHIQSADEALVDPMQPANAIQKAYEHIDAAKSLGPEFTVMQGVLRAQQAITEARRSPSSADFGRLRSVVQQEAKGPASRLVIRNAMRMEEEALAWLKVQELIAQHLRVMSEITGESLRIFQQ